MATIQVKHVPEETHRVLTQRAAAAGQSLQEYLRAELIAQASRPTLAEALARIERLPKVEVTIDQILSALEEGRAGR